MSVTKAALKNNVRIFRRAYIKRRSNITGLYEDDWVEITPDIKSWGTVRKQLDTTSYNTFKFSSNTIKVSNDTGKYNSNDTDNSLWFGYMSQQRTLVKIEAGYLYQFKNSDGIWSNQESPNSMWDLSLWDDNEWDQLATVFVGLVQGDIFQSDKNEIALPIKPLMQVLRDFPAQYLGGYTSTGMTAQQFVESVRDAQDAGGNYIFRPFFGNTTTYWDISSTTINYTNLNTTGSNALESKSVWEIMEDLALAENFVTYITREGFFKFTSRSENTSASYYTFNGFGIIDREYGIQIKQLHKYGPRVSKFYARVDVKWDQPETSSSHEIYESTLAVAAGNAAWEYGSRALSIENLWIPTSTVANTVAQNIYSDVGEVKKELSFTTPFLPVLELLDKITVNYDSAPQNQGSYWDQNDWAPTTGGDDSHLTWDKVIGESIKIDSGEFKLLTIEMNLDKLENKFDARET